MLQSVIVYTLTAFLLYMLANNLYLRERYSLRHRNYSLPFWNWEFIVAIILFATIAGLRYHVGVDYPTYLEIYNDIMKYGSSSRGAHEIGFVFIARVFAFFDAHFFFFFAFLGAVQFFYIYFAFRKSKFLYRYIGPIIMMGPFFITWMNGIRQCIAACMFVFLVEFIVKRKFFLYCLGILIACTIHKSAIILLPLYFIFYRDFGLCEKKKLTTCLLLVCIVLGINPTWLTISDNFSEFMQLIGYDLSAERLSNMIITENVNTAWGPRRLGDLAITFAIFWYYPEMKQFFSKEKYLPLYMMLFFWGSLSNNLFINTSHLFLRPVIYFTIFKLPLCAYLLEYYNRRKMLYHFIILLLVILTYIYFDIYKASFFTDPMKDFTNYKFFFQYI